MMYTKIFSDDEGETHFEDVEVELESINYAPPAPSLKEILPKE